MRWYNKSKSAPRPNLSAAALLAIASFSVLAVWYILLFKGLSLEPSWRTELTFFFHDDFRWFFIYMAAVPIIGLSLAAAYWIGFANERRLAVFLFCVNIVLAASALVTFAFFEAVIFSAPLWWGYCCIRNAALKHVKTVSEP